MAPKQNKNRNRRFLEGYLRHLGVVAITIDRVIEDGGYRLMITDKVELLPSRWWFASRRDAEALLHAIVACPGVTARHTGPNSVRISDGSRFDILEVARRNTIQIMNHDDMQTAADRVVQRADAIMREMNRNGKLQALNREYALRRRAGEEVGGYALWIERKVAEVLNSVANLVLQKNVV